MKINRWHWFLLIVGLWVGVSPFVAESIGLDGVLSNVFSGALVAVIALWELFGKKSSNTM